MMDVTGASIIRIDRADARLEGVTVVGSIDEYLTDLRAKVEALHTGEHTEVRYPHRCPACVKDDVLALIDEAQK